MNLATANSEGYVDYSREKFTQLNPDTPNTVANWYAWIQATSQAHLRRVRDEIRFEVKREGTPF